MARFPRGDLFNFSAKSVSKPVDFAAKGVYFVAGRAEKWLSRFVLWLSHFDMWLNQFTLRLGTLKNG